MHQRSIFAVSQIRHCSLGRTPNAPNVKAECSEEIYRKNREIFGRFIEENANKFQGGFLSGSSSKMDVSELGTSWFDWRRSMLGHKKLMYFVFLFTLWRFIVAVSDGVDAFSLSNIDCLVINDIGAFDE